MTREHLTPPLPEIISLAMLIDVILIVCKCETNKSFITNIMLKFKKCIYLVLMDLNTSVLSAIEDETKHK